MFGPNFVTVQQVGQPVVIPNTGASAAIASPAMSSDPKLSGSTNDAKDASAPDYAASVAQ